MYEQLVPIILPVVIATAVGFVWARLELPFDREFMTRVIMNVGTPCLILQGISGLPTGNAGFLRMVALGIAAHAGCGLLGLIGLRLLRQPVRSYLPVIVFGNSTNMGLPLCMFAFGAGGAGTRRRLRAGRLGRPVRARSAGAGPHVALAHPGADAGDLRGRPRARAAARWDSAAPLGGQYGRTVWRPRHPAHAARARARAGDASASATAHGRRARSSRASPLGFGLALGAGRSARPDRDLARACC